MTSHLHQICPALVLFLAVPLLPAADDDGTSEANEDWSALLEEAESTADWAAVAALQDLKWCAARRARVREDGAVEQAGGGSVADEGGRRIQQPFVFPEEAIDEFCRTGPAQMHGRAAIPGRIVLEHHVADLWAAEDHPQSSASATRRFGAAHREAIDDGLRADEGC